MKPNVFSPVRHRYGLAAGQIDSSDAAVLDVGGYRSRRNLLAPHFRHLAYVAANIGGAWYEDERPDVLCTGTRLPFADRTFPYVISVDTLEHVRRLDRAGFVRELIRVAAKRAVIVVPIRGAGRTDEARLLEYSARFGIEPMPSLVEHERYGLPSTAELLGYVGPRARVAFASPRHLYWSFQLAMLLNTASLGGGAVGLNRKLYEWMERTLRASPPDLAESEAYRAVVTVDR